MYKLRPPSWLHGLKLKRWYRRARSDGTLPDRWVYRPALLVPDGDTLAETMDRIYAYDHKYILVNCGLQVRKTYGT